MALKTTVKVGSITNLSDARYCAGMGVTLLGFNTVEHTPNYIEPIPFQEIRGWFVGPKVVAEIYGMTQPDKLESVLHDYQPDLIELSKPELLKLRPRETSLVLTIEPDQYDNLHAVLRDFRTQIKYLQVPGSTDASILEKITTDFPVLLVVDKPELPDLTLMRHNPRIGLALKGTSENKVGYKSYDELAQVLEQFEED